LGGDVVLAVRRTWEPATQLGSLQNGTANSLVDADDLGSAVKSLGGRATEVTGYEVARVDLIESWARGCWFVLDVNANLGMTSGAFGDEKVAAYRTYLRKRLSSTDRS
jgi:hypothetical protein